MYNSCVTYIMVFIFRASEMFPYKMQVHRESSATVSSGNGDIAEPVAAAEEMAFCRFGLGLYLYHQD